MTDEDQDVTGSCLCGAVKYQAKLKTTEVSACHCGQCQKTTGHYWASVRIPSEDLTITTSDGLQWYQSSAEVQRGFCNQCGASLFY